MPNWIAPAIRWRTRDSCIQHLRQPSLQPGWPAGRRRRIFRHEGRTTKRPSPTNWFVAAGVDHRLRSPPETIDQEYDIEWQARSGQPGRSRACRRHADDIALFTDIDALPITDKIGSDIAAAAESRLHPMRSELTRKPVAGLPAAPTRASRMPRAGRGRQRAAIADATNTQVEHPPAPQTLACGTLNAQAASRILGLGTRTFDWGTPVIVRVDPRAGRNALLQIQHNRRHSRYRK